MKSPREAFPGSLKHAMLAILPVSSLTYLLPLPVNIFNIACAD